MIDWIKKKLFLVKWGRVARKWPVKRLMATTDLDLTADEIAEMKWGIHSWRQLIPWYLARFDTLKDKRQFYCFGVAHGSTVEGLVMGLQNRGMEIPFMHLFDSFEGLPQEDPGIQVPAVWNVGAFSAPLPELKKKLAAMDMTDDRCTIHQGWFSETLRPELVEGGVFQPAAYVDIDADLYNSTMDVLDFMFEHRLIRPGTLIGYDDWGDTDLWTAGESRAHKEIVEKYDVKCAQLFSWGEPPLIRKLFLVVDVGGR